MYGQKYFRSLNAHCVPIEWFMQERPALSDSIATFSEVILTVKGKVFQYSLPSFGPGADPGVQAVSPQVT